MLQKYNPGIEPKNWKDGVNFNKNSNCIFIVYPAGASGDLLASIINAHFLNTGADYFGITDVGQVIFRPSDYKLTNTYTKDKLFTDQWLFDIADSLSGRNKSYSLMDQIIFSNHLHKQEDIEKIKSELPNAKIIKIYAQNSFEQSMMDYQSFLKNRNESVTINFSDWEINDTSAFVDTDTVLYIPYTSMFDEVLFEKTYSKIVDFLQLKGKLIRFDFIHYYISKQTDYFQSKLKEYFIHKNTQ